MRTERPGLRLVAGIATVIVVLSGTPVPGHDRETTAVTWDTVTQILAQRCNSCHRDGGGSFSLITYDDARPWAVAIRDEVLARRMPPWGAVKGFGRFRNDNALSPAQMNLIVSWVEGGVPEGTGAEHALEEADIPLPETRPGSLRIAGDSTLGEAFVLDGLWPEQVGATGSAQITAELPNGRVEPLVWLYQYDRVASHPFLLKTPLELPAGTRIRGIPAGASLTLLPPPPVTLETYTGPRLMANRPPSGL